MTFPAARRRPPGRYDEPSLLGQRLLAVVLVLLVVGLVGAIVLAATGRGDSGVRVRVLGFSTLSDTVVRVDAEVAKQPERTAYCVVRARAASGAETGREVVEVGPSPDGQRTVRLSHLLGTRERAVTGEVQRCSLEPPRPDALSP